MPIIDEQHHSGSDINECPACRSVLDARHVAERKYLQSSYDYATYRETYLYDIESARLHMGTPTQESRKVRLDELHAETRTSREEYLWAVQECNYIIAAHGSAIKPIDITPIDITPIDITPEQVEGIQFTTKSVTMSLSLYHDKIHDAITDAITALRTYMQEHETQILDNLEPCCCTTHSLCELQGRRKELDTCLAIIDLHLNGKGEPE